MLKPIHGTWFEFSHHHIPEGKYWDKSVRAFTDAQWEEKVSEIASLGMKYIVLLASALVRDTMGEAYFSTDVLPRADLSATDPMGALLRAAERHGIRVFVSTGFFGNWMHTQENLTSPDVARRAFRAMEQLYARYGSYSSFYGWYLPDELDILPRYSEDFIRYVNSYAAHGRSFDKNLKILIAPYGTNHLTADDAYIRQLESMDCDIVAYQDEIGVRKSRPEETPAFYEALRRAHDKAGRSALWADMEVFEFEGEVYNSALIPAKIERIRRQMESISPYVDEILIYQYEGMFNRPGSTAFAGHPGSTRLYEDYAKLLKEIQNQKG